MGSCWRGKGMTLGQQHIETAVVTRTGGGIEDFADQVTTRIGRVKSEAENLVRTYRGERANQFLASTEKWDGIARRIRNEVLELAGQVRQAASQHTEGDRSTADRFKQVSATSYQI